MMRDRRRILGREVWSQAELDAHHHDTFHLSVNLMLSTSGCTARAHEVPALIEALAWCSVFRDLDDDLAQGLINIPRGVDVQTWTREAHARACDALRRAEVEIAVLDDAGARKILTIFRRSIARYATQLPTTGTLSSRHTAAGAGVIGTGSDVLVDRSSPTPKTIIQRGSR
jgi:hypothetical protein